MDVSTARQGRLSRRTLKPLRHRVSDETDRQTDEAIFLERGRLVRWRIDSLLTHLASGVSKAPGLAPSPPGVFVLSACLQRVRRGWAPVDPVVRLTNKSAPGAALVQRRIFRPLHDRLSQAGNGVGFDGFREAARTMGARTHRAARTVSILGRMAVLSRRSGCARGPAAR
jgi:hypothetical protein